MTATGGGRLARNRLIFIILAASLAGCAPAQRSDTAGGGSRPGGECKEAVVTAITSEPTSLSNSKIYPRGSVGNLPGSDELLSLVHVGRRPRIRWPAPAVSGGGGSLSREWHVEGLSRRPHGDDLAD